jgi:molybdopterin synthase catalytic subunit
VDLPDGASVGLLAGEMVRLHPGLVGDSARLVVAVNEEYQDHLWTLYEGDEVALIPPVSGGSGPTTEEGMIEITNEPLDPDAITARVRADTNGAVVTFLGTTRSSTDDRKVLHLEYEAYEPMALKKMREIGAEIHQQFPIDAITMVHRLGKLAIGETSVAIVLSSPHRKAAFAACQHGIDRLKQIVPIWKKEFFADGAVWAEGEGQRRVLVETRSHDP